MHHRGVIGDTSAIGSEAGMLESPRNIASPTLTWGMITGAGPMAVMQVQCNQWVNSVEVRLRLAGVYINKF